MDDNGCMPIKEKAITIRISEVLREALDKRAEQERRSRAAVARLILEDALLPKRKRGS